MGIIFPKDYLPMHYCIRQRISFEIKINYSLNTIFPCIIAFVRGLVSK
jgi:hypothetical protein